VNTGTNQMTVLNSGATVPDDYTSTGANSVITFDETVDNYLIFTIQPTNAGDTGLVQFAYASIYD
jgi:hypothetical protein